MSSNPIRIKSLTAPVIWQASNFTSYPFIHKTSDEDDGVLLGEEGNDRLNVDRSDDFIDVHIGIIVDGGEGEDSLQGDPEKSVRRETRTFPEASSFREGEFEGHTAGRLHNLANAYWGNLT